MNEAINKDFQVGITEIEKVIRLIAPNAQDSEIEILKHMCKALVNNAILNVGNAVTASTKAIKIS